MKNNNIIWVLIVIVVVGILIFITFNTKPVDENSLGQTNTMQDLEGVKITILQEGAGEVAKAGDNVSMNYTGTLIDGKAFDSNTDPAFGHVQPFIFTLGAGQVIPGWDSGLVGMKVGEKRRLEIAPEQAYGASGVGDVIPPNATLIFEVEMLSINN